jgi:hypothetical protein
MSEVHSAGNPHHAGRFEAGIDFERTDILRSTKATLSSDSSFSPICHAFLGLAYRELQLGHTGDRVKTNSCCASTARRLAPRAGLLDTVCSERKRRCRTGRSANDEDLWHFDRIAGGRCKCSFLRPAVIREDGGDEQMTLPVLTDAREE